MISKQRHTFRQIAPVLIGSLLGVSFGTMLGWPSIAFPLLVDPEFSPIPITWDQSAMIAGFLMEGNIIGTAFSSITFLGSKAGILISCCCQISGWTIMFFAQDISGIGAARALVGIGNGFGFGQLRIYAQETCETKVFQLLMQYIPISVNIGIVSVYLAGGFLSFRVLSLFCAAIPTVNLFFFAVIPKKSINVETKNSAEIVKTIYLNNRSENVESLESKQSTAVELHQHQLGFTDFFKDGKIRNSFFLLCFLVFIPQYTGGAANIVYSQVIHISALNPYAKFCSVIYSLVFFISSILTLKYASKVSRKPLLLASCILCSLILILVSLYYYYLVELLEMSALFVWSPLILLCLFNLFHTTGVNAVPLLFIADRFPENAKVTATKFYVMHFSLSAVISTKIFQVIFTYCGMHMAYVFLCSVGLASAFIVFLFVKEPRCNKIDPAIDSFSKKVTVSHTQIRKEITKQVETFPQTSVLQHGDFITYRL